MGAARLPRPARVAFGLAALWLGLHELHAVLAPGLDTGPLFSRYAHDLLLLGAGALCAVGALTHRGRERIAWLLIAAGVLAWSLAEIYYTAVLWTDPSPPLPSPADVGYLLFPVLAGTGGVMLLKARARGIPRRRWLDGVTAALAVSAVSAGIVFDTVLEHAAGEPLGVATALAYPITDLILLGLFVGALAGTGWQLDRAWMLLAMGVTTFWLADSLYLVETAQGTYESGGWFDAGWWAGLTLIATAAWQPRPAPAGPPSEEQLRAIALPLAFAVVGLGLLTYGAGVGLNPLAIGLAAASILAVMARTVVVFEDNVAMLRDEALTDMLTGLGNRRALTRALDERLKEITPERPLVLALFDLDGFKHYNDTFGHPAGDALLVRLGHKLASFMEGRGQVFRMGGDEFCALFAPGPEGPAPVVEGAACALTESGEGFSVGCSHGAILLPAEARDAAEALRLADQRMYANKYAARSSAGNRSAGSLLRALAERDPDLASRAGATDFVAAIAELLDTPALDRVAPLSRVLADGARE